MKFVYNVGDSTIIFNNHIERLEDDIVLVTAWGEITGEIARAHYHYFNAFMKESPVPLKYIIDLNNCGKNDPEARNIWKELSEHTLVDKVVLYGLHPVTRVIASFVMRLSRNKNLRFYNLKEEAMQWLKE